MSSPARVFCAVFGVVIAALCVAPAVATAAEPFPTTVPDGLGVNIHFTDPRPGEMEMLAEAGFRVIRMDFTWAATEREPGKYDFSAYERLLKALEARKLRALFILDYSNPHYDRGLSPSSDEGRKAFARWAVAAARHFRGRGVLWEMYNEPNIGFWKPRPDPEAFIKLALEVGKALREATPEEIHIGPATSGIDLPFLEACFKAGLLEYWAAVSVHPYRQNAPESAGTEYAALRRLIDKYAPQGKKISILSGEWGYSAGWNAMDAEKQGKMLPRQWMTNMAHDVPISVWYDWHDDGTDPKEPEHHFGTVHFPYREGRNPVYDPKPAYAAAKTLTTFLDGFQFSKRLAVGEASDYVCLFSKGGEVRLAAWTTSSKPRRATIPASSGVRFAVLSHTGKTLAPLTADAAGLSVVLDDSPQYLRPESADALLQVAAAWQRAPAAFSGKAGLVPAFELTLRNPLSRAIRVSSGDDSFRELKPGETAVLASSFRVSRSPEPVDVRPTCRVEGLGVVSQSMLASPTNPLSVSAPAILGRAAVVRIDNPSGDAFQGKLVWRDVRGLQTGGAPVALALDGDRREQYVALPLRRDAAGKFRLGARIDDASGATQVEVPKVGAIAVDHFGRYKPDTAAAAWEIHPDGDAKVPSTQSLTTAPAPVEPGMPSGATVFKAAYSSEQGGWKFFRLTPKSDAVRKIEGRPKAAAFWVYGNGSGHLLRLRIVDETGQVFQDEGTAMTWKGWGCARLAIDPKRMVHWGGANDGVMHGALRWDTVLLIDCCGKSVKPTEILVGSPVLLYD